VDRIPSGTLLSVPLIITAHDASMSNILQLVFKRRRRRIRIRTRRTSSSSSSSSRTTTTTSSVRTKKKKEFSSI
jgi:hypothetical protein